MDDPQKAWFFDLNKLAAKLKKTGQFKILIDHIRQLQDISSVETDLRYARQDLDLCLSIGAVETFDGEVSQNPNDARVIGALFSQSLIYYTRATKSHSKHRGFAPVTKNWPVELLKLHRDIVKIRDDIIAHFGPGTDHASGFWSREAVVMCLSETGRFRISTPFVRANYKEWAVTNLSQLIDKAYADCLKIKWQRLEILTKQIETLQEDQNFMNQLKLYTFSPESFFVSAVSARAFYENLGGEIPIMTSLQPAGIH